MTWQFDNKLYKFFHTFVIIWIIILHTHRCVYKYRQCVPVFGITSINKSVFQNNANQAYLNKYFFLVKSRKSARDCSGSLCEDLLLFDPFVVFSHDDLFDNKFVLKYQINIYILGIFIFIGKHLAVSEKCRRNSA